MNNRLGNGVRGDTETPEQTIPETGFPGRDWETCMTINDTWGYKSEEAESRRESVEPEFKSTETLLRNLIDIASKGGNYLLNVGPDARGVIPAPEVGRLGDMGAWLRKNGDSIYATTASPYRKLPFSGRATVRGNSMYLNVFDWPNGDLSLPGLKTPIKEIRVLATGERLVSSNGAGGTVISRPKALDPVSTAIEIRLAGKPVVEEPVLLVRPDAQGALELRASDADLTGGLQVEHTPPNVGYWLDAKDSASWNVDGGGDLAISLEYACPNDAAGSEIEIDVDGKDVGVRGTIASTGGWDAYRTLSLQRGFNLTAGPHTVRLLVRSKPRYAVMNLRAIRLLPVRN